MESNAISGMTHVAPNHSVEATVEKLTAILQSSGITLFALIDHSGEAAKAGLKMPPTRLLIFGSPIAGTPLMLAAPSTAIDLPPQNPNQRRPTRKSLALLQHSRVPPAAPQLPRRINQKYRRGRNSRQQSRAIISPQKIFTHSQTSS